MVAYHHKKHGVRIRDHRLKQEEVKMMEKKEAVWHT